MSGNPSEAEIQTQWRAAVNLLESTRNYADGTVAGAAGLLDTLFAALEGEYTPAGLSTAGAEYRAGLSDLVSPERALAFLSPLLFEYGRIITDGSGYTDEARLMRALYEHFVNNSLTVESRAITYATPVAGVSNIGDGLLTRLTADENAFNLEACHVETKRWRCRADQNSGTQEHAESWEVLGDAASFDSLLRAASGSGAGARTFVRSRHAGAGTGGSLLRNSSFSTYDAAASPKFSGWTEASGAANIVQDTTNFFRSHPGAGTDASIRFNGNAKITQGVTDMRISRLDPDRPYFLRLMYNRAIGSGDGTLTLRLGSQSVAVVLAAQTGWNELTFPLTTNSEQSNLWFRNFNEDPLDVEIELSGYSTGYVVVDDVIFDEWTLVDGTYWMLRGGATPWLVDDTFEMTDTGGAPATAKIQWWLFASGLGYLPSAGSPSFTDP